MAKFAPVAPLAVHQTLDDSDDLGDYHLLLAHEVLEDPEGYFKFWHNRDAFIIMDNSLVELGHPMEMRYLLEAAYLVNADVIVLPDVLTNRLRTLELSHKAYEELVAIRTTHYPGVINIFSRKVKTLGVAQGTSSVDAFSCGRELIKSVGVDMISVPRIVADKTGTRSWVVEQLSKYEKPLHLLGFSNNLLDDVTVARHPSVGGIDSALPIWVGNQGKMLPRQPPSQNAFGRRPKDYGSTEGITPVALGNVRRVRDWLQEPIA